MDEKSEEVSNGMECSSIKPGPTAMSIENGRSEKSSSQMDWSLGSNVMDYQRKSSSQFEWSSIKLVYHSTPHRNHELASFVADVSMVSQQEGEKPQD